MISNHRLGSRNRKIGRIGVYGEKTRALQRRVSFEAFGLSAKTANVFKYLGSRASDTPDINDVETKVFYEVPDRAYAFSSIPLPVGMEPIQETKTDFSRFGLIDPLQDETLFRFHIDDFQALGRELIIGDVFELPFFEKDGKKNFWEITDVDLRSETEKYIAIVHASPLGENRKTREIQSNRGHMDIIDGLMSEMEDQLGDQVPTQDIGFDEDYQKTDVDYRNEEQRSFLDDPTKQF